MILSVSITLCFSWLDHFLNLFEVWIKFRADFFVAVKSTVSLFRCV